MNELGLAWPSRLGFVCTKHKYNNVDNWKLNKTASTSTTETGVGVGMTATIFEVRK